tara:strand:- start:628 stop:1167 length:540 start_codon:yes stop_codon:yes gene_type:complete
MDVVRANSEDARAVAEIHVEAWRAAYRSIVSADYLDSLSIERREAMWDECIAAGDPELLVAKKAGVVQGWLSFGQCRDIGSHKSEAEVWAIYVSPTAWSTGVGRVLWLRAKELMLEQGFKSCSLWVFPQNERAIKFYRSVGFAHDGAVPKNFELGGVQLEEVRFVIQLLGGLVTKDKRH